MRNNPDDLANQTIAKIKKYLEDEIEPTDEQGEYDGYLLKQINKWENEYD